MRLLLDTHIFIWWDAAPERLSANVRQMCEDPANTLTLSLVSVWEMQMKSQIGKLELHLPLSEIIEDHRNAGGLQLFPIELEHIYALEKLPTHHRDPFDRLLIAQSLSEGVPLVTADAVFRQYPITVLD